MEANDLNSPQTAKKQIGFRARPDLISWILTKGSSITEALENILENAYLQSQLMTEPAFANQAERDAEIERLLAEVERLENELSNSKSTKIQTDPETLEEVERLLAEVERLENELSNSKSTNIRASSQALEDNTQAYIDEIELLRSQLAHTSEQLQVMDTQPSFAEYRTRCEAGIRSLGEEIQRITRRYSFVVIDQEAIQEAFNSGFSNGAGGNN
jgi:chromosome segregation ATPase